MRLKGIERGASLLPFFVLAAIIWYGGEPREMVPGAPYLLSAAAVDFLCIFEVLTVKSQTKRVSQPESLWLHQVRAQVTLYVAVQLAIIGLLNVWSIHDSGSLNIFFLNNVLIFVSVLVWDRLISLADNPLQNGGAKPLSSLGRPRSRRLFFWAFFVYPSISVVIAGGMIFANGKTVPYPFHAPQLGLILDAFYSAAAAGLIFQRYYTVQANRVQESGFKLVGLLVIGLAVASQFFVGWNLYTNVLSTAVVFCVTLSTCWLSRASCSAVPEQDAFIFPPPTLSHR